MFGADIEFFIKDPTTGRALPICGKVGGEKDNPIKINDTYSILEDGAALELNYTPTYDSYVWAERVAGSKEIIQKHTGFAVYDNAEAKIAGLQKFPQAMEIGCMPDFNAYANNPEIPREIPDITEFGKLRFCGGHIHFSYDTKDQMPAWVAAKFIDLIVTIPYLNYIAENHSKQEVVRSLGANRRKYYGLAGLHRAKPYGVEYRTFSNYFALRPKFATRLATLLRNLDFWIDKKNIHVLNEVYIKTDWDAVQNAINTLDFKQLSQIAAKRIG